MLREPPNEESCSCSYFLQGPSRLRISYKEENPGKGQEGGADTRSPRQ